MPTFFSKTDIAIRFKKDISSCEAFVEALGTKNNTFNSLRADRILSILDEKYINSLLKNPSDLTRLAKYIANVRLQSSHEVILKSIISAEKCKSLVHDIKSLLEFMNHKDYANNLILLFEPSYISDICTEGTDEEKDRIIGKIGTVTTSKSDFNTSYYAKIVQTHLNQYEEVERHFTSARPR